MSTCNKCGVTVKEEADGTVYDECAACRKIGRTAKPAESKPRKPRKSSTRALVTYAADKPDSLTVVKWGSSVKALRAEAKASGTFAVITVLERFAVTVETKEVTIRKAIRD